jgi:hypothetical protein
MSLLNENLSDTDTSMPLLAAGNYELEIASCKEELSSNQKPLLSIQLKTMGDNPAADGKGTLHKGYSIFHRVSLTPTDKYNPKKSLKLIRLSAGLDGNSAFGNPTDYVGKVVKAKVKINPGGQNEQTGQTYEPRNEIASFLA